MGLAFAIAALLTAVSLPASGASPAVPAASPTPIPAYTNLQRFDAAHTQIARELGAVVAAQYGHRLLDDLYRQREDRPDGYVAGDWDETLDAIVRLDGEAVDQLVSGIATPLRAKPGLHAYFVPSRSDGTWQAFAMYVPATVRAGTPAPLAVALHGNPQTEAELLGQPFLRRLADRTGTIVVAPFGRGIYDFAEPAAGDLYDLLTTVQSALRVDKRRTYLVGYSMGGFSVFMVGPRGGYRWAAAMCISGAILNSGVRPVSIAWRDLPLYVVTGVHDDSIPSVYGEQTARYLAAAGLPVSFYAEPNGTHALRTLVPALERAWVDMHGGKERPGSIPRGGGGPLLQAAPASPVKI